jgi:drug/metabolite transporter (DMT)-like permease
MDNFWLFSLLAPVCLAASNLIDNHVLHKRLSDAVAYDIVTTWATVPIAIGIFLGWKVSFAFDAWFVGSAVGFAFAFLFILYNLAMIKEQGTNVVSVIYTSPLFIAILAAVFLAERLTAINYAGILLLVFSAVLVLYRRIDMKNVALGFILAYAFAASVSRVVTKSALESVDVWSYYFWFLVGGIIGTAILAVLRPRSLSAAVKKMDATLLLLIAATVGISTVGLLLLYSAFSLGSVALASGLSAIQPTVLFVYSTVLLRLRPGAIPPERITGRWANARKVGAVLLIALGALALTGT